MSHDGAHRYQKMDLSSLKRPGNFIVWRCTIKGCAHYVQDGIQLGRECVCYRCGKTFILNRKNTRNRARPSCGCGIERIARMRPDIIQKKKEEKQMKDFLTMIMTMEADK